MEWRRWLWILAGASLAASLPTSLAQGEVGVRISRPTDYGPSEKIGGRYTREKFTPLQAPRQNVSLWSQSDVPIRGQSRGGSYAATYSPARLGLLGPSMDDRGDLEYTLGRTLARGEADAMLISGLQQARDLENALPGLGLRQLPALSAYLYTPRPPTTRVQDILGLAPTAPLPEGPPLGSTAERLNARTAERVEQAKEVGVQLFKQATQQVRDVRTGRYAECPDCGEKLSRAIQQLRMVRDLDDKSYLAPLLMAHAYLEQERLAQALQALMDAFRRAPDFLTLEMEHPFDRLFGDAPGEGERSAYLAAQMRRYQVISDVTTDSLDSKVLEAYCAWRLGERMRAREAVDAIEKLAPSDPRKSETLLIFAAGMRAALQ